MLAAVSSTPLRISSAGAVSCENAAPNRMIARDAPQMIHLRSKPVGKARGEQRRDRIGEGDDEGILQALGDGDALLDQQRRHPVGETIEAEGLAEVEHHEHHDQRQIGRLEQVAEADRRGGACAGARLRIGFGRAGQDRRQASSLARILRASLGSAVACQPERAFRHDTAAAPRSPCCRRRRSRPPSASHRDHRARAAPATRRGKPRSAPR